MPHENAGTEHHQDRSAEARHARGLEILKRIGGEGYDRPMKRLAETAPDLARFMVEFGYGDVLARGGLDLPTRQLVTVASLMAQGSVQPQLKFHMAGLLNAGGEPADLVELLFLAVPLLGFTATIDAVGLVREVFQERGVAFDPPPPAGDDGTGRAARGLHVLAAFERGAEDFRELERLSPDFARWWVEFVHGELLSRCRLAPDVRQLACIAMLATAGNRADALRTHVAAGLRAGLSREAITEALMQLSVYIGFPTALNAFAVASAVFAEERPEAAARTDMPADLPPWTSEERQGRLERGLATLARTSGEAGGRVVNSFDDIAPDIGRILVEHSYGDVFCRPGLDPKTRELAACSALAAVATKAMETPLRVHVDAALAVGATRTEIVETLLNLAPYRGYAVVAQALRVADEAMARRGA
ncbi:carboxymuconolactone decarboxylase family protein [Azospirillum sp. sgz302134]